MSKQTVFQGNMIRIFCMGLKKVTHHTNDYMAKGIGFDEDLVRLEPVNYWGGTDFIKLHAVDVIKLATKMLFKHMD